MTTGSQFANVTNKRLMSFEDFRTRTIGYLRELMRDVTARQFSRGAFVEKIGIAAGGSNRITLTEKATLEDFVVHDGAGHILDLEDFAVSVRFENTNAVTYQIGAAFCAKPVGIVINPRTGLPDYDRWEESVGDEAAPNSVVDNGSTITFRVDSLVANSGESLVGRTVRVFKLVPASGATSPSIAIEELAVAYGGGQNTVTTASLLGQSTVSTTAADYAVQLVGLSIRRSTNPDPIASSDVHFYAGTVLGNAGTPATFSTAAQGLTQADEASAINFVPYTGVAPISWNLSAGDVQAALEELVDDLTDIAGGAELIRSDSSAFIQQLPAVNASWGGLGATGTSVADQIAKADIQLACARWFISHSVAEVADYSNLDSVTTFPNEQHSAKGSTTIPVTSGVANMLDTGVPTVAGESMNKTKVLLPDLAGFNAYGRLVDMTLMTQTAAAILGDKGVFIGERLVLAPFAFSLGHGAPKSSPSGALGGYMQPTILRDCFMPPSQAGSGSPANYGLIVNNTGGEGVKLIENCVFVSSTTNKPCLNHNQSVGTDRYLSTTVYRNCIFRATGNSYVAYVDGPATFVDCKFVSEGVATNNAYVLQLGTGALKTQFINCEFKAHNGKILQVDNGEATFIHCRFEAVNVAQASTTNPTHTFAIGQTFIDCDFVVGQSNLRTTAAAVPIASFASCKFKRCKISFPEDVTAVHNWTNFSFVSCDIDDLEIKLYNVPGVGLGPKLTTIMGGAVPALVYMDKCNAYALNIHGSVQMAETQALCNWVPIRFQDYNKVDGFRFEIVTPGSAASAIGLLGVCAFRYNNLLREVNAMTSNSGLPQLAANRGMFEIDSTAQGNSINGCTLGYEAGTGLFAFNPQGSSDAVFRIAGDDTEVNNVRNNLQVFTLSASFCIIDGGKNIRITNNDLRMSTFAAATRVFVRNRGTTALPRYVRVTGNHFRWLTSATPPTDNCFIDLSSTDVSGDATYSSTNGNVLLNENATAPVVYNGGTGAVSANNIVLGSAT